MYLLFLNIAHAFVFTQNIHVLMFYIRKHGLHSYTQTHVHLSSYTENTHVTVHTQKTHIYFCSCTEQTGTYFSTFMEHVILVPHHMHFCVNCGKICVSSVSAYGCWQLLLRLGPQHGSLEVDLSQPDGIPLIPSQIPQICDLASTAFISIFRTSCLALISVIFLI